jgi:hypothetical protein
VSNTEMGVARRANPTRSTTRGLLWASVGLIVLSVVLQPAISPTADNLIAVCCAAAPSLITFFYLFGRPSAMIRYPLSSLTLLGFNVSSLGGALVYQSVVWTPLAAHLINPVRTFAYLGLFQITLVASHLVYTRFVIMSGARRALSSRVIARLGLFRLPTAPLLWLFGLVGLGAVWFSATSTVAYGDVGGKFVEGLIPFAYAPLLIPFLPYLRAARQRTRTSIWPVTGYVAVLIAVGIVRNSRSTFAGAFLTLGLLLLLMHVSGNLHISRRAFVAAAFCAIPAVVAVGYATDLSTAMIMARSQRTEVTGVNLLKLTLEQLAHPEAIQAYRQSHLGSNPAPYSGGYSEYYISNPIFARLITVKFDDNVLHVAPLLTPGQRDDIAAVSLQKIAALLPTPAIRILGLDVDKAQLGFSVAGYIYNHDTGWMAGPYPTGSMTAYGLILFGPFLFVILFFAAPVVFLIADAFTHFTRNGLHYAPLALVLIYSFWSMFYGDSLIDILSFMLRSLPQTVLIYVVVSKFSSVLITSGVNRRGGPNEVGLG